MKRIIVIVVGRSRRYRKSVSDVLMEDKELDVLADMSEQQLMETNHEESPDVILFAPAYSDHALINFACLKEKFSHSVVLVLLREAREEVILDFLDQGADGWLLAYTANDEIKRAVHKSYRTGFYLANLANRKLLNTFYSHPELTDEEIDMLIRMLCERKEDTNWWRW